MSKEQHIMLDFETLDLAPTAVLLSIGAVRFDPFSEELGGNFYMELDWTDQPGRTTSQATIDWWNAQPNPPINGTTKLTVAVEELNKFIKASGNNPVIWCQGTDFDIPKLNSIFEGCNTPPAWKYNSARDLRTLTKVFKDAPSPSENVLKHNALADAVWQAKKLQMIYKYLGLTP